jgi:hypothetical protein
MSFKTMDDGQVLLYAVSDKPKIFLSPPVNYFIHPVLMWFTFYEISILQFRLLLSS